MRLIKILAGLILAAGWGMQSTASPLEAEGDYFSHSALRFPGESYLEASERVHLEHLKQSGIENPLSERNLSSGLYARIDAVPYNELDFSRLSTVTSEEDLFDGFKSVRDSRFLEWSYQGVAFDRRSTWLYPDDGCFARAALMVENSENLKTPLPLNKVFAFGNLKVQTSNAASGQVRWWYHVVPILSFDGVPTVFDPAIEPSSPLTLEEWAKRMGGDETISNIKFAICHRDSYVPSSECLTPSTPQLSRIIRDQSRFLPREWSRIESLGRLPEAELGDAPPWAKQMGQLNTGNIGGEKPENPTP